MKGGHLLDVVVAKGAAILELFAGEDETLLVWRDPFLVLNIYLNIVNSVTWLNLDSRSQCHRIPSPWSRQQTTVHEAALVQEDLSTV